MNLHTPLDDILNGVATLRTFRALVLLEDREFTGREAARVARLSPSQARAVLLELERQGMARRRVVGPVHLWRVERQHVLYRALKEMLGVERGLMDAIRSDIAKALEGTPARRATIFGSVARGKERSNSDLDLFVEVPTEWDKGTVREALHVLFDRVAVRYGTTLSPLVYSAEEVRSTKSPSFLDRVRSEGIVALEARER
ncbi:MAG: nucleotidyltransferase domain-containing protein [Euryarchaeota archaeon]|nr:nucleotidyltransferase domain-containing protein [Euryarchaeota archaeon]